MRRVLGAAFAAVLVLTAPAGAGPSCNLVTDPPRDDKPDDAALDLLSGDVAGNDRELTVAIRLRDLVTPAATSPAGVNYTVALRVPEARLEFLAALSATKPPEYSVRRLGGANAGYASVWFVEILPVKVRGTLDAARDEVRMTVALRDLAAFGVRKGAYVVPNDVFTWRTVPLEVDTVIASADYAESERRYRIGSPSCLAVGR